MRTAVVFTALVAVFSAAVVANAAEQLDKAQFDSQVLADDAGAFFVKFYAPWCGHCKRLAPTWDKLAAEFDNVDGVSVIKVDCTAERDICKQNGVRGYPTLKLIKGGDVTGAEKYQGSRSFDALKGWLNEKTSGAVSDL